MAEINLPDPDSDDAYNEGAGVQLLDEPQKVSYYWTEAPKTLQLHIIVQSPCTFLIFCDFSLCLTSNIAASERPAKKRRLDGEEAGKIA